MSKVGRTLQLKKSLNVAFAANDLHRVCGAIDAAVLKSPTIIKVAQDAGVNRTTLYRAFRCQRGPALSTMIKVLRVLGFQLVVQANRVLTSPRHDRSAGSRLFPPCCGASTGCPR